MSAECPSRGATTCRRAALDVERGLDPAAHPCLDRLGHRPGTARARPPRRACPARRARNPSAVRRADAPDRRRRCAGARYCCVPSDCWIDLRPLWPPAPPSARSRQVPTGIATSSTSTSRSVAGAQNGRRAYCTSTPPDRFMYVCGFTSRTVSRTPASVALRDLRLAVLLPAVEAPALGEVVDEPPADVVARVLVLFPRISEAQDDLHRLASSA